MAIDIKKLQAEADGRLNRKDRRAKERKTGIKIVSTNKPYVKPTLRG